MELSLTNGELVLGAAGLSLRGVRPVLNGAPLENARPPLLRQQANLLSLSWTAPALGDGLFEIELVREDDTHAHMRYWLDGLPPGFVLDSFGVRFEHVANLRAYLRQGYSSWDGSSYIQPRGTLHDTGYAMTQLLPDGEGSLVLGFDRHDRFQQTFTFDSSSAELALTIETLWDRKTRVPRESCESEQLVVLEHPRVEAALREWAHLVAAAAPTPPRHTARITGWCSWYDLYASITEENILEHLRGVARVVRREQLPMRVFQIDDGFTPEMGDWLQVKPQFPRGMGPVLDEIRDAGFIPGLWIAPFMVGNRSQLYREHPDWVVRDRATGGPLVTYRFYGEFRWHKRSEEYYVLDTTHPAAADYLRLVFRTWRREWGCQYFKTDFLHLGSDYGPDRAVWHTPGSTRIEVWRRALELIHAEIGEALWLACGPLWASVGLYHAVRIGRDVGVSWRGQHTAQDLLHSLPLRNFANGILWQADPDCVLLRQRFHELSAEEVRSLALYAGLSGGVLMTSDALDELSAERLRLWKFLLEDTGGVSSHFPLLGRVDDAVLVETRARAGRYELFVFNTGDEPVERHYALANLGLPSPAHVLDTMTGEARSAPIADLSLRLEAHKSALLFVS